MKQFFINRIYLHPYDGDALKAVKAPGNDCFDDRSDFILFKKQMGVSVLIDYRCNRFRKKHDAINYDVCVKLFDKTSRRTVAQVDATLSLDTNQEQATQRINIPFAYDKVKLDHDYEVRIQRKCTVLEWHSLRFFSVKTVVPKDYDINYGYLWQDDTRYINIDSDQMEDVEVVFGAEKRSPISDRQPEFRMRIVDSKGDECDWLCDYNIVEDENGHRDRNFQLRCVFPWQLFQVGVTYCELRLLGIPVAAIVVNTLCTTQEGMYSGHDLGVVSDYTPEMGEDIIARRDWSIGDFDLNDDDDSILDSDFNIDDLEEFIKAPSSEPSAREQLDRMVGLDNVKSSLKSYCQLVHFGQKRKAAGLPFGSLPLHSMFLGSPGTGKTTVAKIMGKMMHEAGVLSKGHVVVLERSRLTGMHYGDEEAKTLAAIEEAEGGILFIDEAYQLHQPNDPKDPGHFVLDTLMTALADESKRDWMLILAGYTNETLALLKRNPGLASRIPESNHYYFADYKPSELMEIAMRWFEQNQYCLTPHANDVLKKRLEADYAAREKDFGNGRHVKNLIETGILPAMAARLAAIDSPSTDDLKLIHACDIPREAEKKEQKHRVIGFTA